MSSQREGSATVYGAILPSLQILQSSRSDQRLPHFKLFQTRTGTRACDCRVSKPGTILTLLWPHANCISRYWCHHTQMSHDTTKPSKWVCAQRRHRSTWTSAQFDQSLRCAFNGQLRTQAFFMWTATTLIRLGGCPGWSESSLGAQPLCWFYRVAAKI